MITMIRFIDEENLPEIYQKSLKIHDIFIIGKMSVINFYTYNNNKNNTKNNGEHFIYKIVYNKKKKRIKGQII